MRLVATWTATSRGSTSASVADSPPHLVLVGLPGSGKRVIGHRLARSLRRAFVDLDTEIARRARATVQEIFAERGETGFRTLEHELTAEIARRPGAVIAPGGGWITRPATVALVRPPARLIYLQASVPTVIRQMGAGISRRPLLAGEDPAARLEALLAERAPAYETADVVVNVDDVEAQEVTRRIIALLPASEVASTMASGAGG